MQSDVLESIDRSPNERHSFNPDPLHKYLAPSKVKKSETPSTFQQAVLLRSNYDKSLKFLKVVLVVLLASMLLLYILNRPQKQFIGIINQIFLFLKAIIYFNKDEEIENVETKEEKYEKYEERFVENNIINEEILPIIRDVKDDSSSYHFQWLSLENLRKQTNLDDYLDEKIHNEFKASKLEKEIENTLHLYYNILNTTEGLQWNFNSPKIEELERKIESFLISKKNLTQIYEKGFSKF